MSDLIDRQAAIDALRVAYWDDNIQSAKDDPCIVDAMTDWAIRQVKALPPAQHESLVNESRPLVKDTISRQAAIDGKICIQRANGVEIYDDYAVPVEYLKQLPSAQPEIIYCKDCVKHNKGLGNYEVHPDGSTTWIRKDSACPLVSWRDKAQGHEFDYQFCAYAEKIMAFVLGFLTPWILCAIFLIGMIPWM